MRGNLRPARCPHLIREVRCNDLRRRQNRAKFPFIDGGSMMFSDPTLTVGGAGKRVAVARETAKYSEE